VVSTIKLSTADVGDRAFSAAAAPCICNSLH